MSARPSALVTAMLAVTLAAALTACGGSDGSGEVAAPTPWTPAGARELTESVPPPEADTSCGDPTTSLRPDGELPPPNQMPSGSTMAAIQNRGRIIVGVDQNTYLFGYRDSRDGRLYGFDVDIARQLAIAIFGSNPDDARIEFTVLTSAQRIPALKEGSVDVVVRTFTINCERRKEIAFSTEYFRSEQRVLAPKGAAPNGLADLGGKRVCAAKDSTSIRRIANDPAEPVPIEVANWSDCLVLLQLGQVEAISTDDTILAGLAAQDPNLEISRQALGAEPYGIGVPIANVDMVRFVNGVLDKIRADGTWAAIYRGNLAILGDPPQPPAPRYEG